MISHLVCYPYFQLHGRRDRGGRLPPHLRHHDALRRDGHRRRHLLISLLRHGGLHHLQSGLVDCVF